MTAKSRLARTALALISAAALTGGASENANVSDPAARPAKLVVLPDGRKLNFRCSGAGSPTVLLEGGFGSDSLAWYKVQPTLAQRYRVCAYDRAGAGFSDPGPLPRDGSAIARDLHDGLRAAGVRGPYILVGHSSGGLYDRAYAAFWPKEVVAMVQVDPSVTHQDRRFAERFGPGAGSLQPLIDRAKRCLTASQLGTLPSSDALLAPCVPAPGADAALNAAHLAQAREPGRWLDQISELETLWTVTSDEVDRGPRSYADMPLIVLTAGASYAGVPESVRPIIETFWSDLHREIAGRSTRGREERVQNSSHLMMLDRPDAIIAAVDEVAGETRRPSPNRRGETGR